MTGDLKDYVVILTSNLYLSHNVSEERFLNKLGEFQESRNVF